MDQWGREYDYEGEIDKKGKACGFGEAARTDKDKVYAGTFLNDMKHGLGKKFSSALTLQFIIRHFNIR